MKRFDHLTREIRSDPRFLRLKQYTQHGRVTTYDHCLSVARLSYRLARSLKLKVREREMIRGALLHDYYLYDWHDCGDMLHGFHHPKRAVRNAKRDFHVSDREENIIRSHMWPLTFGSFPRSREAALVCIADKICSLKETLRGRGDR